MTKNFVKSLIEHIRSEYQTKEFIPLHAPHFGERERRYVLDAIDSGFVSSIGAHVTQFEDAICKYTGAKYAVATTNGTSALHTALLVSGVMPGDEVITQTITFIATCNVIRYCSAEPILVDIDRETLGMSHRVLSEWLEENAEVRNDGLCWNRNTGRIIRICMPMHNFGHPVRIELIASICKKWHIKLVEDAAESLGSFYHNQHTGLTGNIAAISFNGNKIITSGGGGMLITNSEELAIRARHITTTAKVQHPWLFIHNEVGYNYRMPAINAALGLAQVSRLPSYVELKRELAKRYEDWFKNTDYLLFKEPSGAKSNYWFNSFFANDRNERDYILEATNKLGVMTRPVWTPMHTLEIYKRSQKTQMLEAAWIDDHLINIPSSVQINNKLHV